MNPQIMRTQQAPPLPLWAEDLPPLAPPRGRGGRGGGEGVHDLLPPPTPRLRLPRPRLRVFTPRRLGKLLQLQLRRQGPAAAVSVQSRDGNGRHHCGCWQYPCWKDQRILALSKLREWMQEDAGSLAAAQTDTACRLASCTCQPSTKTQMLWLLLITSDL